MYTSSLATLAAESYVEPLIETLMEQQSASLAFRELFKSKLNVGILIDSYTNFVGYCSTIQANEQSYIRILEKMNHLLLSLALDTGIDAQQKQEVRVFTCGTEYCPDTRLWTDP